ncbi:23758_t:CDS:2, partial [Cetraspora pellucida]
YFKFNEADNFYPGNNVLGLLLKNLCLLTVKKPDNDNIMKEIPMKERQQIYLFLRNLVFDEDGNHEHWFIYNSKKQLIDTINEYRTINDHSKKNEIEDYASSLIRDVINIFYFRRYTCERIINYMWIKNNEPIDPLSMNEVWDDDVNVDNMVVQFCSFPLFGTDLENLDKRQAWFRAHIEPHNAFTLRQRGMTLYMLSMYKNALSDLSKTLIPEIRSNAFNSSDREE